MMRIRPTIWTMAALLLLGVPGCTALQEMAALRSVTFAFDRVSGVRVAGVALAPGMRASDLSLADMARVSTAIVTRDVPLEMIAHVSATNPAQNRVAARMVSLGWTMFVDDRRALAGEVGEPVSIAPGATADVPVAVRLDLLALGSGGARDLVDLALAIAGQGAASREMRLELVPTIDTALGPMRYPAPIVLRRGGAARE